MTRNSIELIRRVRDRMWCTFTNPQLNYRDSEREWFHLFNENGIYQWNKLPTSLNKQIETERTLITITWTWVSLATCMNSINQAWWRCLSQEPNIRCPTCFSAISIPAQGLLASTVGLIQSNSRGIKDSLQLQLSPWFIFSTICWLPYSISFVDALVEPRNEAHAITELHSIWDHTSNVNDQTLSKRLKMSYTSLRVPLSYRSEPEDASSATASTERWLYTQVSILVSRFSGPSSITKLGKLVVDLNS